jgi:hypothetical protein
MPHQENISPSERGVESKEVGIWAEKISKKFRVEPLSLFSCFCKD